MTIQINKYDQQQYIVEEQSSINTLILMQIDTIETKQQCGATNNDGSNQNGPWKQSNRKFDYKYL